MGKVKNNFLHFDGGKPELIEFKKNETKCYTLSYHIPTFRIHPAKRFGNPIAEIDLEYLV